MRRGKGRGLFIFTCAAPAIILFLLFMVVPTIDVFRMSMYKWGGYTPNKTFVGMKNFQTLLQSEKFIRSFQNQILLIVCYGVVLLKMLVNIAEKAI